MTFHFDSQWRPCCLHGCLPGSQSSQVGNFFLKFSNLNNRDSHEEAFYPYLNPDVLCKHFIKVFNTWIWDVDHDGKSHYLDSWNPPSSWSYRVEGINLCRIHAVTSVKVDAMHWVRIATVLKYTLHLNSGFRRPGLAFALVWKTSSY